jgi:hypothetical protein
MSSARRSVAYRSTVPLRRPELSGLSDAQLLRTRLCDLGLRFPGSPLEARTEFLGKELAQRGIVFRPHLWLSTDWFSPDEVPGFAIPFYLAHPRLQQLETEQMHVAEGGTPRSFRQLMRHETGHALDSAYRLHEREEWQELFGSFAAPYRLRYPIKPRSKRFVRHLDNGYAQSHPAEDFAETLAVWLDPESDWRARYRGWPALDKLEYVDRLMRELGPVTPLVRRRERVEPISTLTYTLGAYYEDKRRRYAVHRARHYDRALRRLFRERTPGTPGLAAAAYLRSARPEIRKLVADRTGAFQYDIDRVLSDMIKRSARLDLVVAPSEARAESRAGRRVAAQVMRYLRQGHHLFAR